MGKTLRQGDRVSWSYRSATRGKKIVGTVIRRITSTKVIKGHTAKATSDDPQYLVESDGGGQAAHHPDALTKIRKKGAGS